MTVQTWEVEFNRYLNSEDGINRLVTILWIMDDDEH